MVELDSLIELEVDLLLLVNVHDVDDSCHSITILCNDLLTVVHKEHARDHGSVHVEEGIAALVQIVVESDRWEQEERIAQNSGGLRSVDWHN